MFLRLSLPLHLPADPRQKAAGARTAAQITRVEHPGENRLTSHADPSPSHTSPQHPNGSHEYTGGFYALRASTTAQSGIGAAT